MEVKVERLDHLGLVAGTIRDLKIIELINERIGTSKQEIVSTGEAVAAMIINGLGFSSQPLYLSPEFFANKALSSLFNRDDIDANNFNATKLSKSLDAVHNYGLEKLFMELAVSACTEENIDTHTKSLDTTSLSLTGAYDAEHDEQAIRVAHGFSKDHRADLKQVIVELLVSQDGGVPLMVKTWDGNAADTKIFKERAKIITEQLDSINLVDYLIADSKLYTASNAVNLAKINFITRIPNSNKQVSVAIKEALALDQWKVLDAKNKYHAIKTEHLGIKQRWMIVYSTAANSRAEKRVEKKIKAEQATFNAKIKELVKQKYSSQLDLTKAVDLIEKKLRFHAATYSINALKPKKSTDTNITYTVEASLQLQPEEKQAYITEKSCYVIGSNATEDKLTPVEVIAKYKKQNSSIENMGFRFIKDPLFFTSSLFIKLPRRIEALVFIMTLALLVYAIAQRKLRAILQATDTSVKDQLKQPTKKPTLRWIFQILSGINVVYLTTDGVTKKIIEGINDSKATIIGLFGSNIKKIYGFQT